MAKATNQLAHGRFSAAEGQGQTQISREDVEYFQQVFFLLFFTPLPASPDENSPGLTRHVYLVFLFSPGPRVYRTALSWNQFGRDSGKRVVP